MKAQVRQTHTREHRPARMRARCGLLQRLLIGVATPAELHRQALAQRLEQLADQATLIEDPAGKDALLKKLIGDHEPPYAEQWRGLGEEFAHKMLAGIVAFELRVTGLQCKLKLNQHRPEAHVAMHAAYAAGTSTEQTLARWMEDLGLLPQTPTKV